MSRAFSECLRIAIDGLGGDKRVGAWLRPEIHPVLAGQWVAHCLDDDRREKFSGDQIATIFARAKEMGRHDGFTALAELCGYRITAVLDPREELSDLANRALRASQDAHELNAEMIARARALHLDIEGVA